MSETTAVSVRNAAFGGVSGVTDEVAQFGGGPSAIVATQPAGRLGSVTLSKFSAKTRPTHGVAVAVAVAVAVGVAVGVRVGVAVGVRVGEGVGVAVGDGVGVGVAHGGASGLQMCRA